MYGWFGLNRMPYLVVYRIVAFAQCISAMVEEVY